MGTAQQKAAAKRPLPELGDRQLSVLRSLVTHGDWHERAGWIWSDRFTTEKILKSLMKRKLVFTMVIRGRLTYRINQSGKLAVEIDDTKKAEA